MKTIPIPERELKRAPEAAAKLAEWAHEHAKNE